MASATSETSPLLSTDGNRTNASSPNGRKSSSTTIPETDIETDHGIHGLRAIAIVIATGVLIFFQATNMSMITTIQSSIAEDLDAYDRVSWFTSAYLVSMSSFAPVMGRLSQIFSPRRSIFGSTIMFAIGSVVTALAKSFEVFVAGRALCGVGGAGVFSIAIIIVLQLGSIERRGLLVGLLNSGFTIGVSLGAIAAGGLLSRIGWRALFWIQAPFVLVAGLTLLLAIPKRLGKGKAELKEAGALLKKLKSLDYLGALSLILCITAILIGLSSTKILVIPVVIGVALIPVFVLNEAYLARDPVVPVIVLKSRGTLLSCLSTVGFMMCRWTVLFYTPVYSIAVRGWNPAAAGAILLPTNTGFAIGGLVVGIFHVRRAGSFYAASLVTFILFPITLFVLAIVSTATIHPALYVLATFANGLTVGAALNYTLAHVLHLTIPETHFIVTALLATFRGFAGSFGSAVGGGVFSRILRDRLQSGFAWHGRRHEDDLIRKLLGSPALVWKLPELDRDIAIASYVTALRGLFIAAAGLGTITILAQAGTGWTGPKDKMNGEETDTIAVTADAHNAVAEPVDGVEPVPPARTSHLVRPPRR